MRQPTLWQIDLIPWYAFAAYWAIKYLRVKPTKTAEPLAGRVLTIVSLAFAFELLFDNRLRLGLLDGRFLPDCPEIGWVGIALTTLGVAVAIWARYCLGQYWSARVTLKEGHQIIRSGPYRFMRHPIYTGMLLATMGTAMVVGQWRGALAVTLLLVVHSLKARREERLLISEFGEEYATYRRSTGFLFPRLRSGGRMDTPNAGS